MTSEVESLLVAICIGHKIMSQNNRAFWVKCLALTIALDMLQFAVFECTASYFLSFIIGLPVFAYPFIAYYILCKVPNEQLSLLKRGIVVAVLSLAAACLFLLLLVSHMAP